jgi:4-aminobutyrate aminotransferase-like enzyme
MGAVLGRPGPSVANVAVLLPLAPMSDTGFGRSLPQLQTEVPGPRSRQLAARLRRVESRNLAPGPAAPPIFWAAARGANVRDVDDNVYIDLTAGFGVAATGHSNPRVAAAIGHQARTLAHGLGDVHPSEVRLALLERLVAVTPAGLDVCVLAGAGAEAVEVALKTALLRTGRPGVVAFEGSYHGLTYGALGVTGRREFREPFRAQLSSHVRFAPYPDGRAVDAATALAAVERGLNAGAGAVIVEPILGRGGLVVPPVEFLQGLRRLCDGVHCVLIFDEIYTGFGRTGAWFACQGAGVLPDILVVGKALAGSLPLSAAIGSADVMRAWPEWSGEALHTSTFIGNPIACAAALAQLDALERGRLVDRARRLGLRLRRRLDAWRTRFHPDVAEVRGQGLLAGVRLTGGAAGPAAQRSAAVVGEALQHGVILLSEGPAADVLAFTPPFTITRRQLDHALDVVEAALAQLLGAAS